MTETILALHPDPDKQPTRINQHKYETVRDAILQILADLGETTFTDLADELNRRIGATFDGSTTWYCTTVKLDLEARGLIERIPGSSPQILRPTSD